MEEDKEYIEELRARIGGKGKTNRKYPQINVGDRVKVMRKPGKYGEHKIGFVAWSRDTYRVERIEYEDGDPLFHLEGVLDSRPYRLHEILKVDGVEKPRATRVKVKQTPNVSTRAPSNAAAAAAAVVRKEPVILRRQPADPPPRRRIRGKTADPSYNVHPLAHLITA